MRLTKASRVQKCNLALYLNHSQHMDWSQYFVLTSKKETCIKSPELHEKGLQLDKRQRKQRGRTSHPLTIAGENQIRLYGGMSFRMADKVMLTDEPTRKRVTGGIFRISVKISAIWLQG